MKPGGDDRYSSVSYDFMNTWFHTGSAQHKLLRTSPYCADVTNKSIRCSDGHIVAKQLHDVQSCENTHGIGGSCRTKSRKRPLEEDQRCQVLAELPGSNTNSEDEKEDGNDASPPIKRKTAKISERSGSRTLKNYEKLKDLQQELRSYHAANHVLTQRNVYGIVEEVLEVSNQN